jgi:hypothetical protein
MTRSQAQGMIAQVLLDKIENDRYPSITQMDLVEQLLPPDQLDDYLALLMDKAAQDTVPSIPMLQRILRVAESLPVTERSSNGDD